MDQGKYNKSFRQYILELQHGCLVQSCPYAYGLAIDITIAFIVDNSEVCLWSTNIYEHESTHYASQYDIDWLCNYCKKL